MKKLVLYSDQIPPLADNVDRELMSFLGKPSQIIGYVPSKADPQRKYYTERRAYYSRMDMDLRVYFELDNEYQPALLESLFNCDAIHLSGGDVYYFLYWLRKRKLLEPLRNYVRRGGVLIGVSAGSILMSPDISISPLYVNKPISVQTDFSSLNLVDFAFAPHYGSKRMSTTISVLREYSRNRQIVVYACKDSGGVIVTNDVVRCIGDVYKIDER